MLRSIIRYLKGYLSLHIGGPSTERFFNLCNHKKIDVWGVKSQNTFYELYIYSKDFKKLKPIFRKTKTKLYHIERHGIRFLLWKYKKRKSFLLGAFLCCLIIYSFTFFVWDIEIKGNQAITDDSIVTYLETIHVSPGIQKKNIQSNEISRAIRAKYNEIVWVSVFIKGNKLHIHVKENTITQTDVNSEHLPCNLIAKKSGFVKKIVTRKGIPNVKEGDEVNKGQILVSGKIPIMNDAKEIVGYQEVVADADIEIAYEYKYNDMIPNKYQQKQYTSKKRVWIQIHAFHHVLDVGVKKNKFQNKELFSTKKIFTLGKHFDLPVEINTYILRDYRYKSFDYNAKEQETILTENYIHFCEELKSNGAVVVNEILSFSKTDNGMLYNGTLKIVERNCIQRENLDFIDTSMLK